jgi:hypothetical protein
MEGVLSSSNVMALERWTPLETPAEERLSPMRRWRSENFCGRSSRRLRSGRKPNGVWDLCLGPRAYLFESSMGRPHAEVCLRNSTLCGAR